jgi:histidine triad (HIT) family protein
MPSIFTRIIAREIPANIVHEDEVCIAIHDISPKAPVHLLVVPKKEIVSLADLTPEDAAIMGHLMMVVQTVAVATGLAQGYRVVINCGADGGQEVPHIHLHVLGGRRLTWPPG